MQLVGLRDLKTERKYIIRKKKMAGTIVLLRLVEVKCIAFISFLTKQTYGVAAFWEMAFRVMGQNPVGSPKKISVQYTYTSRDGRVSHLSNPNPTRTQDNN